MKRSFIGMAALSPLVWFTGCEGVGASAEPKSSQPSRSGEVLRSVVPTPKSWERNDVLESFRTAAASSDFVSLSDPVEWWGAGGKGHQNARVYQSQQWQNMLLREGRTPVFIQLDPYKPNPERKGTLASRLPAGMTGKTFADADVRQAFITEAVERQKWYGAKYVCLAMEINAYYAEQPGDFDNFVSLFAEARDAIRANEPEAIVFVSFQHELMMGRIGTRSNQPQWNLLAKFEPYQDAVGISSYPQAAGIKSPSQLSDDYYSQITRHTSKPVVFAELGWTTDAKSGGSEANQAEFLTRLEKITGGMKLLLVNYFFLYDTKGYGAFFDSMGLIDQTGREKQAFDIWKKLWSASQ